MHGQGWPMETSSGRIITLCLCVLSILIYEQSKIKSVNTSLVSLAYIAHTGFSLIKNRFVVLTHDLHVVDVGYSS